MENDPLNKLKYDECPVCGNEFFRDPNKPLDSASALLIAELRKENEELKSQLMQVQISKDWFKREYDKMEKYNYFGMKAEIEDLKGQLMAPDDGSIMQMEADKLRISKLLKENEELKKEKELFTHQLGHLGSDRKCGHFVKDILSFCPNCLEVFNLKEENELLVKENINSAIHNLHPIWLENQTLKAGALNLKERLKIAMVAFKEIEATASGNYTRNLAKEALENLRPHIETDRAVNAKKTEE